MYNCLLKIALKRFTPQSCITVAETSVIVKVADAFEVYDKFFKVFNMPEEHLEFGPYYYFTACEVAPVTEFTADSQLAEELDENNPFKIHSDKLISRVWHVVNEWKYSGLGLEPSKKSK